MLRGIVSYLPAERSSPPRATTIVLCRDCCCGSEVKHAGIDHEAQKALIESAVRAGGGRFIVAKKCLDECDQANVVVVRWREGHRVLSTWLGGLLTSEATDRLCDWLRGGPDGALPSVLEQHRFSPSNGRNHDFTLIDEDAQSAEEPLLRRGPDGNGRASAVNPK
jgi:hypothetical protein